MNGVLTTGKINSHAEDLFIEFFCGMFDPKKSNI